METTNNLINTDRIPLSESRKPLFIGLCTVLFISTLALTSIVFYTSNNALISISGFFVISFIGLILLSRLRKKLASGYLRNNMVVLKMMNDKNYVMEYRCIKEVRTFDFFGYKISRIHFKFDGVQYTCFLLGDEDGKHGGDLIREARKAYLASKKKASHKPGSVHSA